ncbi:MAG: sugar ABC transporter substrate-binding protein, partial [Rhodothermales bacterium]
MRINRFSVVFAALLLVASAGSGCQESAEGGGEQAEEQTYFVVSHGSAGNPFWAVVVRGAMDA